MQDKGLTGPHPDIRDQICEMANMLAKRSSDEYPWPSRPFVPDDLTILGQRTWNDIVTVNHVISGGGVSALLVRAEIEGRQYGGLVMAGRKPGTERWGLMGAGFGDAGSKHGVRGDLGGSGHFCIGFYGSTAGFLTNLHALEVEYADGTVHRAEREDDGCTIVFAPVERREQKDNEVVIRFLDANGDVVHSETRWPSAGLGPPANES